MNNNAEHILETQIYIVYTIIAQNKNKNSLLKEYKILIRNFFNSGSSVNGVFVNVFNVRV